MSETVYEDRDYCLRPGCHNYGKLRGLCRPCYKAAERLVKEGKIASWDKIIARGLALPAKGAGRPAGEARKYFLEECK